MSSFLAPLAIALVALDLLTIFCFAMDKRAALQGERRTRESTLLWLAARRRYRNKTRKQPFLLQLQSIAMLQAGVALGLCSLAA